MSESGPRPELLSFLGAIKAEPEEDTPKLALADWLQEQPAAADQARGEFLRQFVRDNRLAKADPAREDFGALVRLWDANERAWAGRLRDAGFKVWATNHMFRWGLLFPALDNTPGTVARAVAVAGTEEYAWVAGVTFRAVEHTEYAPFADSLLLDSLVGLRVAPAHASFVFQSHLYGSPRVAAIRSLDLAGGAVPSDVLANSRHLSGLRQLSVRRCSLTDAAFRSLCDSERLAGLHSLDAAGNDLSIHAARAFAVGAGLPALTDLDLGHAGAAGNRIGPDGALILIASTNAARLRKLNLAGNGLADYGVEAICRQPHVGALTHLDLSDNRLTRRAANALAGAEHLDSLEVLNLSANGIDADGARALANTPHLVNLRRLDLTGNRINREGAAALRERFGDAVILD